MCVHLCVYVYAYTHLDIDICVFVIDFITCDIVLLTEAVSEPFDILNKISFSISRSRSEPVMAHAPPVLRQPKQEPEVLGERSEAGGNDDARSVLEERRKPRATNASLASITVSRSSLQDDAATGGMFVE